MMTSARYWLKLAMIAGIVMNGCGGYVAGDEDSISESEAAAKSVTFPAYIVYAQPVPGINPLFNDVQAFIFAHDAGINEAASFPPHVSLTGFFDTSLMQPSLRTRFERAVANVGTPFGQPLIMPKQGGQSAVQCNPGTKLVTLHVRLPSDYNKFRAELVKIPGAQGHVKTTSHITVFQAIDPKAVSKTAFDRICNDAKVFFGERIALYNSTTDGFPQWQVTLFLAPQSPTPAHPLRQSDAIDAVLVNP